VTGRASDPAAAAARGPAPRIALLAEFDFASGMARAWTGVGELAWAERVFLGTGDLIGIGAIEETIEARSAGITMTLSAAAMGDLAGFILDQALAEVNSFQGRPVRLWLALLADDATLLAEPVPLAEMRMDTMAIADGRDARITLTAEGELGDLDRPRIRRFTNEDQQAEFPGDRGLEYVPGVQELNFKWGPQ
jgi:hypothetical protein